MTSGDYDADGYADVAACGGRNEVVILFGSPDGLGDGIVLDRLRTGVCDSLRSGDVNDDGYDDLVTAEDSGMSRRLNLYAGSAEGLHKKSSESVRAEDLGLKDEGMEASWLAASGSIGDLDGDGRAELAVSAVFSDGSRPRDGAVALFSGSADGPELSEPEVLGELFVDAGSMVELLDVRGDDRADLLVSPVNRHGGTALRIGTGDAAARIDAADAGLDPDVGWIGLHRPTVLTDTPAPAN